MEATINIELTTEPSLKNGHGQIYAIVLVAVATHTSVRKGGLIPFVVSVVGGGGGGGGEGSLSVIFVAYPCHIHKPFVVLCLCVRACVCVCVLHSV